MSLIQILILVPPVREQIGKLARASIQPGSSQCRPVGLYWLWICQEDVLCFSEGHHGGLLQAELKFGRELLLARVVSVDNGSDPVW